jgi:hypothetical protein
MNLLSFQSFCGLFRFLIFLSCLQALLDNEKIFPSRTDVPFPKHFESVVKQVLPLLFIYTFFFNLYFFRFSRSCFVFMLTFITRISRKLCLWEKRRI